MKPIIKRRAGGRIAKSLAISPAVILRGPRQIGKSTLAKHLAKQTINGKACVYFDLEHDDDLRTITANPVGVLEQHRGQVVILDEIQNLPEILKLLRALIDKRDEVGDDNGHFLLLGSASDNLLNQSQSLAGRVIEINLHGLNLLEVGGREYLEQLMQRGGYPKSFTKPSLDESRRWLRNYSARITRRDLKELGLNASPIQLLKFLELIADVPGRIIKRSIAGKLSTTGATVQNYLDKLADLLLVTILPAYHLSVDKRILKSPKYYFRDIGLAQIICGSLNEAGVSQDNDTIKGLRWESFVIENLLSVLPNDEWQPYYFRSQDEKMEIDLIVRLPGRKLWAIEIKQSFTYPEHKFIAACNYLQAKRAFLVHKEDKPKEIVEVAGQAVEILPLDEMMTEFEKHDNWSENYQPKNNLW